MSDPHEADQHPPIPEGEAPPVTPFQPLAPVSAPVSAQVTAEALAAQAQALEGVRRLHIDLADRLAAGEQLRSRVDRVSDGLEELRSQQTELKRAVEQPRSWRLGVLVIALLLGGVGGVWSWERWADEVPGLRSWRRAGGPAHLASLLPGGVAVGDARSPDAAPLGDTIPVPAPVPALAPTDVRELRLRAERAEELLDSAREERNKQLGENARLRQALIEKQLQLDQLKETVTYAAAAAEARRVVPVPSSRSSDREPAPLLSRVNEALRVSGIEDLQIVEVNRADGIALRGLLVRDYDRVSGKSDVYPMQSAHLSVHDGVVSLVLTPEPSASGEPGEPTALVLSAWDPEAWGATGLTVPEGFVPVNVVMDALDQLFLYHAYELVSLGGFENGEMRDLVVRQLGSDGSLLRSYSARRAVVVSEGPELVLYEGVVTEDGLDRPFWRGQSRLPLPGSHYAAWLEVTGGPGG